MFYSSFSLYGSSWVLPLKKKGKVTPYSTLPLSTIRFWSLFYLANYSPAPSSPLFLVLSLNLCPNHIDFVSYNGALFFHFAKPMAQIVYCYSIFEYLKFSWDRISSTQSCQTYSSKVFLQTDNFKCITNVSRLVALR